MKKLMTLAGMAVVMALITGCLTRASAHTKKTIYPDGRIEFTADTSIVGTGDKASQVAGEGMFADGTEEDLGAGFKKGNASQESTGIGETLAGVGQVLEVVERIKNGGAKTRATPAPAIVDESFALAEAASTTPLIAAKQTATPSTPRSAITAEGVPVVAIFGNRATCSRCRTLWGNLDAAALSAALCNASVIDADMTDNPSAYNSMRPKSAFSYPLAVVYDAAGKLAGQFDAKGLSQAQIAEKVKALVPACASTQ